MNIKDIQKYIKNLRKKRKKHPRRKDLISLYEWDTPKFQKRRKRAWAEFFRNFSIPFSKGNIILYSITGAFLLLAVIIYIVTWPFFEIKNIYITRQNTNVNIDMAYNAVDSFRGKKSFNIDTEDIKKAILKNQESIEDVTVSLRFPDSIHINITAYDNVFQTHIREAPYTIVTNGSVIPLIGTSDLPYIILYQNSSGVSNIPDYKEVFSPRYIEAIEYLKNSLVENIIALKIKALHYFVAERELIIELETWEYLIFDLTWNLPAQIEKIVIFHNENGDITTKNIIYIDNRIDNKIFYCDTSTEYLCRVNIREIYGELIDPPELEIQESPEDTNEAGIDGVEEDVTSSEESEASL